MCFDVTGNRVDKVTESQGVPIIVYDYYEPGKSLIYYMYIVYILEVFRSLLYNKKKIVIHQNSFD